MLKTFELWIFYPERSISDGPKSTILSKISEADRLPGACSFSVNYRLGIPDTALNYIILPHQLCHLMNMLISRKIPCQVLVLFINTLSIPATSWALKLIEYSLPPQNSKPCYPSAPALPNFFELIRQKFRMWILFLDFSLLLV